MNYDLYCFSSWHKNHLQHFCRLKNITLAMKCLSSRDAHVLLPQFKICCLASCKLNRQIAFGEIKLNIKK